MAIETDKLARGCSAHLAQPVGSQGVREADFLFETLNQFNNNNVVYRSAYNEYDIHRRVFRWSILDRDHVFQNGFSADVQGNTSDATYYNIRDYVYNAGPPLGQHRNNYAFVSTTDSSEWTPQTQALRGREVYRYEIFAPGGIEAAQTLANYQYTAQDEVIFVRGINRQYIRSAQTFRLLDAGRGHLRRERVDTTLFINPYFDPASHPERRLLELNNAVNYCYVDGQYTLLNINYTEPSSTVRLPPTPKFVVNNSNPSATSIWYGEKVGNVDGYINAGFRSWWKSNEAYLFMRNEYVLVNYAPGKTNDKLLNGPLLICEGFPSLANTPFAEYGVDCAFGSHYKNQAYIFAGNLCALINFAPHTTDDKVLWGPMNIAQMFPIFKGTGFDQGVDAAFESSTHYEAYIFKGDRYALINYRKIKLIGGPKKITDGFYSLRGTIFASGMDAAFASHRSKEAYIFKGDQYALINFAPGGTKDHIIGGIKKITPNWPSLASILPRKNRGLDDHNHSRPDPPHGHEEL